MGRKRVTNSPGVVLPIKTDLPNRYAVFCFHEIQLTRVQVTQTRTETKSRWVPVLIRSGWEAIAAGDPLYGPIPRGRASVLQFHLRFTRNGVLEVTVICRTDSTKPLPSMIPRSAATNLDPGLPESE